MPNRNIAPSIHPIRNIQLPTPERYLLDNGIPVYETRLGTQKVVRLEIAFHSGRPFERKDMVARATGHLLTEGTASFDAASIAESIDFYGASLSNPVNLDYSVLTLYSLNKHFEKLLPIIAELLTSPLFPEKELSSFIARNVQRLQVDLAKNDSVAYRTITEKIFGKKHPYGYNSFPETYRALTRDDLVEHFKRTYVRNNCTIFISGKTNSKTIRLLNQYLGNSLPKGIFQKNKFPKLPLFKEKVQLSLPDSLQTAIRIGRKAFNRNHPDYLGLYTLNTILGGYFGSRLMENIREEKGYTYNIFSSLDAMLYDGYFYIGTEVSNEHTEATIEEIYKECARLQTDLITTEELEMVRNYQLGTFLTMLDGPFNVGEVVRTQVLEGLPIDFFQQLVESTRTITAPELRDLAQRYLKREDMWEVTVGA